MLEQLTELWETLEYLCVCAQSLVLSDSLQPHGLQPTSPLSMGLSRQEYWSGLPFPAPGDLPDPGIEPMSLAWQADSLLSLIMQSKVENRHSRQNNTETKPHILYNLNCEFVHKSFLFT